ncbi:unnamed protein product [Closterium sp. NIES-54]
MAAPPVHPLAAVRCSLVDARSRLRTPASDARDGCGRFQGCLLQGAKLVVAARPLELLAYGPSASPFLTILAARGSLRLRSGTSSSPVMFHGSSSEFSPSNKTASAPPSAAFVSASATLSASASAIAATSARATASASASASSSVLASASASSSASAFASTVAPVACAAASACSPTASAPSSLSVLPARHSSTSSSLPTGRFHQSSSSMSAGAISSPEALSSWPFSGQSSSTSSPCSSSPSSPSQLAPEAVVDVPALRVFLAMATRMSSPGELIRP